MSLFYEIIGLAVPFTDLVLTIIWIVQFPKWVEKISLNYPNDNGSNKKEIDKKFINRVAKLFSINLPTCVLCGVVTYLDLNNNQYPDPYLVPLIVFTISLISLFLVNFFIIGRTGKKCGLDYQLTTPATSFAFLLFSFAMGLGSHMLIKLISLI